MKLPKILRFKSNNKENQTMKIPLGYICFSDSLRDLASKRHPFYEIRGGQPSPSRQWGLG